MISATPIDHRDPEYLSHVTLMVLGDDLDPVAISRSLRLRPSQSWRKGEPWLFAQSVHSWGGWKKLIPKSQSLRPLPAQLRFWVRTLRGRQVVISELVAAGYLCTLDCYVDACETASIVIPNELQHALAELGLELRVSFFASAVAELSGREVTKS